MYAIERWDRNAKAVNMLVQKGADLNVKDNVSDYWLTTGCINLTRCWCCIVLYCVAGESRRGKQRFSWQLKTILRASWTCWCRTELTFMRKIM